MLFNKKEEKANDGVVNVIQNVKTSVIISKGSGKFYNVYDDDAFIMNLLFGYQALRNDRGLIISYKSGFPDNALNKVINKLEDNKISYKIIYKNKEPLIKDFGKKNRYLEFVDKTKSNMELTSRIDLLVHKIKEVEDKEKLEKIIEAMEQCLK